MKTSTLSRARISLLCIGLIGLLAAIGTSPANAVLQATRSVPPATGYITGVVVTDDQGRFMLPELPNANYSVWVRGFGLVDSAKIQMKPGTNSVTLKANPAKTPQEAAQVYPGNYWLSLMQPPALNLFPGTGAQGNGVGAGMLTQNHWINSLKSGCNFCHQLGNRLTRTLDDVYKGEPNIKTSFDAWDRRLHGGVRGDAMYSTLNTMGHDASLKVFADWTDRVAKGEVPPAPERPKGIERNVVVTLWDVGDDHSFMHDEISTDRNHPTLNANGPIYAVSAGHGQLVVLNPKENSTVALDIPTRDPKENVPSRFPAPNRPSIHWGNEHLWGNPPYDPADPHNPMIDSKGRVWMTSKIRANQDPPWCSDPSNKYADWFPLRASGRQASFYDPKTGAFTLIDTCFATHHLQFDNDPDETLYFNELTGPVFGWIDTKVYDQTQDEQKAGGWCGQVLDTNGDGKITKPWNMPAGRGGDSVTYQGDTPSAPGGAARGAGGRGPGPAFDPKLDTMVNYAMYSVIPSPVDDTVWGVSERYPGFLIRLQRGDN